MNIDQFAGLVNAAQAGSAASKNPESVTISVLVDGELYTIMGMDYDTVNDCLVVKTV